MSPDFRLACFRSPPLLPLPGPPLHLPTRHPPTIPPARPPPALSPHAKLPFRIIWITSSPAYTYAGPFATVTFYDATKNEHFQTFYRSFDQLNYPLLAWISPFGSVNVVVTATPQQQATFQKYVGQLGATLHQSNEEDEDDETDVEVTQRCARSFFFIFQLPKKI